MLICRLPFGRDVMLPMTVDIPNVHAMFMDPGHKDFDYYTVMWAEWLESIRKDVECVFGILKQR